MQTTDMSLGITTAFIRNMGRLKHGFPQDGYYTLTWRNSRTKAVIASMSCRVTTEKAIVSFCLTRNGEQKPVTLFIPFTWTACNYGGRRTWFLCQCGRRVGKVFFKGEQYGCRHCLRLTYQSRRDCQINRAWGRIYTIGKRLKLDEPLIEWHDYRPPPRPKWMHRQRHRKLWLNLEWQYRQKDMAIVQDFERTVPGTLARLMNNRG